MALSRPTAFNQLALAAAAQFPEAAGLSRAQRRRAQRGGLVPSVVFDFLGGQLDPRLQFSRSSNATRFGPTGRLEWAPANYLLWSEDLTQAAWSKLGTVPPAVSTGYADPGGGMSAWLLDISAAGDCRVAQVLSAIVPTVGAVTASVWMRTVPGDADGLVGMSTRNRDGSTNDYLTPITSEWKRVTITYNPGKGGNTPLVWWATRSIAGSTVTRCLIWHPQFEAGDTAREYISTGAAPAYGPRFDYDPVSLAPRGLLIGGQSTNYITQSVIPVLADWTRTGDAAAVVSIVDDAVELAAAGLSLFAGKVVKLDNSAGAGQAFVTGPVTALSSGVACASAWLRSTGPGGVTISADYAATQAVCATTTKYQRFSHGSTPGAANGYRLSVRAGAGSVVYVALPQYEPGLATTSFIPTDGSAATRAADACSISATDWLNAGAGTLLLDAVMASPHASPPQWPQLLNITDGTTANTIQVYAQANAASVNFGFFTRSAGVNGANYTNGVALDRNASHKAACAWSAAGAGIACRMSVDGAAVLAQNAPAYPVGLNSLTFGSVNQLGERHIRGFAYYPVALADETLQRLSA